jgi:hypothetical protein
MEPSGRSTRSKSSLKIPMGSPGSLSATSIPTDCWILSCRRADLASGSICRYSRSDPAGDALFNAGMNLGGPSFRAFCERACPELSRRVGFARDSLSRFPHRDVTSNLDPRIQTADHLQGGGGTRRNREPASKSSVLKILTSKPLALKILRAIFAKPAPVKAFRGGGGRGVYPSTSRFSPNETPSHEPIASLN